jgi:CHAT domain-containing protein
VAGLTKSVRGAPPLPGVGREIEALGAIARPRAVLEDETFTTAAVERTVEGAPFTVVHLASHGLFTGDPKGSFILTWDGRLDMDRLEAMIRGAGDRGEPVELLTLSACETAAGDDRSALGLAGLAVKVGARSALASLWPISDASTVPLVTTFYRNLAQPGVNRAEALRRAQLKVLAEPRFRHPFYWAAFLMIGNWE